MCRLLAIYLIFFTLVLLADLLVADVSMISIMASDMHAVALH